MGHIALIILVSGLMAGVIALVPTQFGWYQPDFGQGSALGRLEDRFSTLTSDATTSSLGQRIGIWEVSGQIIRSRPWFEINSLPHPWLRQIVGYGPDWFAPVFMLRSPPVGDELLPLETNHPHNYLILQWVELGILGFLGILAIFLAAWGVPFWKLLKQRRQMPWQHRLLLAGLMAVLAGRFVEQMLGVAKVSDLIFFWSLLAVLVSLPRVMASSKENNSANVSLPQRVRRPGRTNRLNYRQSNVLFGSGDYVRLGTAGLLAITIFVLTWVGNISNVRALTQVSELNQTFLKGDLEASLLMLNKAAHLAPGVYHYRSAAGAVYSEYQARQGTVRAQSCSLVGSESTQYETCLSRRVYQSYLEEVEVSPWRWRSRLDLAEATENLVRLTQEEVLPNEVILKYQQLAQMVPHSWKLQNQLGRAYVYWGSPQESLAVLEQSLAITGDSAVSAEAMVLRGLAYERLGQSQEALAAYGEAINLNSDYVLAYSNLGLLYSKLGDFQLAIKNYGRVIELEANNAPAHNNLGNVYSQTGEYSQAIDSYSTAIHIDSEYILAYINRGNTYLLLGQHEEAIADFSRVLDVDPGYANVYASRAVAYSQADMSEEAMQDMERAVDLGVDRASLEKAIEEAQVRLISPGSGP